MLSIAKSIKIKVLLRQFSLLMFNLRYIFLFTVFLLDCGIAGIREMPYYQITPGGPKGAERENKTNKTLWDLSFRHAFYLVRVVHVADIGVSWFVYIRSYCEENVRKHYVNINWC